LKLGFSRRYLILIILVGVVKVVAAIAAPLASDFVHFIYIAQETYLGLASGTIPPLGAYTGPGSLLSPFFGFWLALTGNLANPALDLRGFITELSFVPSWDGLLLVFFMKLPMLLFDFLTGYSLSVLSSQLTGTTKFSQKVFLVWWLNPFNLYLIDMWGEVDVIPAALLVVAVILALKRKWTSSGMIVAMASIIRLYPMLLLPAFLIQSLREGKTPTVTFAAGFLAPIALGIAYLMHTMSVSSTISYLMSLTNAPFFQASVYGNELLPALLNGDVALRQTLFLMPLQVYVILRLWRRQSASPMHVCLAMLLLLFATSGYEPYRFTWVTPFLTAYYSISEESPLLFSTLFGVQFLGSLGHADYSIAGAKFFFMPRYNSLIDAGAKTLAQYFSAFRFLDYNLLSYVTVGILFVYVLKVNVQGRTKAPCSNKCLKV
jgi:hypothetical protein